MKILLIEDDVRLADKLSSNLKRAGFGTETCQTIRAAEAYANLITFDVIVVDRNLPDGDAVSLVKRLRKQGHETPILMLTARGTLHDKVTGLEAGCDDYLVKPFSLPELIVRIRALLRRPGQKSQQTQHVGNLIYESKDRNFRVDGTTVILSRHELLILERLFLSAGGVVPKDALIDHVYGTHAPASNAIPVHVHNLRRHLFAAGATITIATIRGLGYLLVEKAEKI